MYKKNLEFAIKGRYNFDIRCTLQENEKEKKGVVM